MSAASPLYNLALATAAARGSVSLGRGDEHLATVDVPQPRRHNVDLMPTIDHLCQQYSVRPNQIGELYLSIGPGSFTGLRIAVATAKMLALTLNLRVVAVPTIQVVAQGAPPPRSDAPHQALGVGVNLKQDRFYGAVFRYDATEKLWIERAPACLMTLPELLAQAPRPLKILGDPLPPLPAENPDVDVLPPDLSEGRSPIVWALGRRMALQGMFADPATLAPLYARPPEAQELWDKRQAKA